MTLIPTHQITIAETEFLFDRALPVMVLRRAGKQERVVSWPDLNLGVVAPEVTLLNVEAGVWVIYGCGSDGDEEEFGILYEPQCLVAVWVGLDGTHESFTAPGHRVLGATREGLWSAPNLLPQFDEKYFGGPLPAGWSSPTPMLLHALGQKARSIIADRYVLEIAEDSRGTVVYMNPSPPVVFNDSTGSTYSYRSTALVLGGMKEIPDQLNFRDFVPDGWGTKEDAPEIIQGIPEVLQRHQEVIIAEADKIQWKSTFLSNEQQEAAVRLLNEQFPHNSYWNPVPDTKIGYGPRDTRVWVEDSWPETRLMVEVTHPSFVEGRIRRTYRVFDRAGRVDVDRYASVWFAEDLDTCSLPSMGTIRDGVLEG
ncbi:hypothetical protein CQ018_08240 [Arthrobacter sp. MYb227]|uniref:hypothetical protein n=1 Tax=Arthrobacter sp. MYb227 TaxID=1848601 RepID=UPI000CFCBC2D|nr:hypothetical protein [Arthrobacter sp. MYb227]PQZ93643.1 hypothetical protein CQ018_08240 [Arthrobacter sp. MYb227]